MSRRFVLAVDQGTTSSKAFLITKDGQVISSKGIPLTQHYPEPGFVEHDPDEIYFSVLRAIAGLLIDNKVQKGEIVSMGITNQRETTVCFDRETLRPFCNAICWQCRRTSDICKREELTSKADMIALKTGLKLDPYFSGTKMRYIFENIDKTYEEAGKGNCLMATVDAYLIYRLTDKKVFATDYSNASRTLLFNINTLEYDEELLKLFDIPRKCLADPVPSSHDFGQISIKAGEVPLGAREAEALEILNGVHITGVAGDQAAALFGQTCFEKGESKTTFGTGCFTLMNVGTSPVFSSNGLLTSCSWSFDGVTSYALEGSVFQGGSIITWLKEEMGLIREPSDCDRICSSLPDNGGVYLVPAFTGLGAPFWNSEVRGAILGLTRGTGGDYIVRAGVESIAYQVALLAETMKLETGNAFSEMKVDGGVCACDFLMQLQSDILGADIVRAGSDEMTALGVGFISGFTCGFYSSFEELKSLHKAFKVYKPAEDREKASKLLDGYGKAVKILTGQDTGS